MSSKRFYAQKPFFDQGILKETENIDKKYADYFDTILNEEYIDDEIFIYETFDDLERSFESLYPNNFRYHGYEDQYKDEVGKENIRVNDLIGLEKTWLEMTKFSDPETLQIYYPSFFILQYDLTVTLINLVENYNFKIEVKTMSEQERENLLMLNGINGYDEYDWQIKIILKGSNEELLRNIQYCLTSLLQNNFDYLYDKRNKKNGLISREYINDIKINYTHDDLFHEANSKIRKRVLMEQIELLDNKEKAEKIMKKKV